MTTPRDCRLHGTSIMPPFVEFDMSSEGFSCLYLPSVAPQSVSSPAVVGVGMVAMGSDASVIGGIGTGQFLLVYVWERHHIFIYVLCDISVYVYLKVSVQLQNSVKSLSMHIKNFILLKML